MQKATHRLISEIDIAASPERVWQALTDAEELTRWFPLYCEADARPGGWFKLMWDLDKPSEPEAIEAWEPGKLLATRWPMGEGTSSLVEYHIQGVAGSTKLTVVTSAFGEREDWEETFDSFRRGWLFELRGLKHYLEHHDGQARHVAMASGYFGIDLGTAWGRLVRAGGIEFHGSLAEGTAYRASLPGGVEVSGQAITVAPPKQFVGTANEFGNGLFRLELGDPGPDGTQSAWIWMTTYEQPASTVEALAAGFKSLLQSLGPVEKLRSLAT